jgi:hypothetical protein
VLGLCVRETELPNYGTREIVGRLIGQYAQQRFNSPGSLAMLAAISRALCLLRRCAAQAADDVLRVTYLDLARRWRIMAHEAESLERKTMGPT